MGNRTATAETTSPPLAGVTVIEIGNYVSAPMVGLLLADFGAEVVKIEPPGRGDDARRLPPELDGEGFFFIQADRNKRSVAIDLKSAEGRETAAALVRQADVLLDNLRPGALAELGLDYESLRPSNPRLVGCSVTGYGEANAYSHRGGYDPILQAMSGLMLTTGYEGDPPTRAGSPVVDFTAAMAAAFGIVLALRARERTGTGERVECSLMAAASYLMACEAFYNWATGEERERPQRGSGGLALIPTFTTADGRALSLSTGNYAIFERLCAAVDRSDLLGDRRWADMAGLIANWGEVYAALSDSFRRHDLAEWEPRLDQARIPWGPVNTVPQFFADPVVREELVSEVERSTGGTVPVVRPPLRLSVSDECAPAGPPRLGEDTDAVLGARLGWDAARLLAARERGAIA